MTSIRRRCRIFETLPVALLLIVVLNNHDGVIIIPRAFGYNNHNSKKNRPNSSSSNGAGWNVLRQLLLNSNNDNNKQPKPTFAKCGVTLDNLSDSALLALCDVWNNGPNALKIEKKKQKPTLLIRGGGSSLSIGGDREEEEENFHYNIRQDLQPLIASTFESVVTSMAQFGYQTKLDPFDLFHGHMFVSSKDDDDDNYDDDDVSNCLLGIIFHSFEYPAAKSKILEGIDLGHGCVDSDCHPTLEEWRFRNILWITSWQNNNNNSCITNNGDPSLRPMSTSISQGIWLLDGTHDIVSDLRVDATDFGPDCPNTVWEGYLGRQVGDVIYKNGHVYCNNLAHHEWKKK